MFHRVVRSSKHLNVKRSTPFLTTTQNRHFFTIPTKDQRQYCQERLQAMAAKSYDHVEQFSSYIQKEYFPHELSIFKLIKILRDLTIVERDSLLDVKEFLRGAELSLQMILEQAYSKDMQNFVAGTAEKSEATEYLQQVLPAESYERLLISLAAQQSIIPPSPSGGTDDTEAAHEPILEVVRVEPVFTRISGVNAFVHYKDEDHKLLSFILQNEDARRICATHPEGLRIVVNSCFYVTFFQDVDGVRTKFLREIYVGGLFRSVTTLTNLDWEIVKGPQIPLLQ